jgi:outer membrane immunogenic protein
MKKLALGFTALTALAALAAPATAADIVVRAAPAKAPVFAPVFSWNGCYLGVHGGGGWQASSFVNEGGIASGVGVLGGVQAGCNYQIKQFVIGVEGEFWGSTLKDRSFDGFGTGSFEARSRNLWDAALSVRAGLAIERALVYGKLGAVWGRFEYSVNNPHGGDHLPTVDGKGDFVGVLIGVGFDYALTDKWIARFEYNYIDYGNKMVNFTEIHCDPVCPPPSSFRETVREIKQLAKIGLSYKFR